jgi:hypothetical protein
MIVVNDFRVEMAISRVSREPLSISKLVVGSLSIKKIKVFLL